MSALIVNMLIMRYLALAVLVVLPLRALAGGQTPETPAFEVVAIRPTRPAEPTLESVRSSDIVRLVGNQLRATNISAVALVHAAYRSEYPYRDQIAGADGWMTSERFDLEARASSVLTETLAAPPLPRVAELMLRRVLQERFQLRVRQETRELPRLVLTYASEDRSLRKGIRLSDRSCMEATIAPAGDCAYLPMPGKLLMRGRTMQTLADFLSIRAYAGGRVVDGTGITGPVDVDLEWTVDWSDMLVANGNLATAVQEQLGLKLENRRPPTPVLVIEQMQRPSGN